MAYLTLGREQAYYDAGLENFTPEASGIKRTAGRHEPSTVTVDYFVSTCYLPHIQLRKRSWAVDERISRRYISPAFGARRLSAIPRGEVEQWMERLRASGLAAVSCNRILAVFKSICTLAVHAGVLAAGMTPCSGVQPFKNHVLRERYLSSAEAHNLMQALKASGKMEAHAIRLLMLTGARKSEILTARWEYVRLDLRILTVPLSKSGRPRHIPLSDEAIAVIRSLPRTTGSPWLFPGHAEGKPLSDVFLFRKKLRRELGINDVRIHDLRHTFASCLVNAGRSLYEVQKILGHSDPKITMRYAHLGQASLLAAAEVVSAWLFSPDSRTESTRHAAHCAQSISLHACATAALCSS